MIQSIVISIPSARAGDPDQQHRAMWLVHGLTAAGVLAKLGWSVTHRGSRIEIAGVLGYWREGWDVLASPPVCRAIGDAGLERGGIRTRVAPAPGFEDEAYCGSRVRGELELVSDVIAGMPALRLKSTGAYVAAHCLALEDRTLAELNHWDDTYRRVFTVWLSSGLYESWAEREIFGRTSELNKAGRAAARKVARDTGLTVSMPVAHVELQ